MHKNSLLDMLVAMSKELYNKTLFYTMQEKEKKDEKKNRKLYLLICQNMVFGKLRGSNGFHYYLSIFQHKTLALLSILVTAVFPPHSSAHSNLKIRQS